MGWRFVKQPNGLLARFSEVVDDFTHYDLSPASAMNYCVREQSMSLEDTAAKLRSGVNDKVPWIKRSERKGDGLDRWRDALETIEAVHGRDVRLQREREILGT